MDSKEAIEIIKKNWPDSSFRMLREALETLIPELKESEDEKIRKELFNAFQEAEDSLYMVLTPQKRKSILAWLEKQAEKNYEFPLAHEKMETERWKEACKAACCDVNYRSHYGLTETRDDYFVDGVHWADKHPTWKPSEEQMKILRYLDKGIPLNDFDKRVLHVLIEQLNKLREE